ncbi:MAG: phage scaffolding protein [Lachnospiraceae bacterium]|nr:phage scaffolding protein [Lachnospiraceae bacterium]
MLKIIIELEKLGLELTDEQKESIKKSIGEEVYSKSEHEKKVEKVETERDGFKQRAETAEETLKGFEGKDFDTITKERDEWKKKAEAAEEDFKKQIEERDYKDAVEEAVKDLKFTSNSAKKAFMSDIMSDRLKMKDGKLLGFSDYVEAYKKDDASAFVDEKEEEQNNNAALFTDPMSKDQNHQEPVTGDPNKMDFATYKKWREQNQ